MSKKPSDATLLRTERRIRNDVQRQLHSVQVAYLALQRRHDELVTRHNELVRAMDLIRDMRAKEVSRAQ